MSREQRARLDALLRQPRNEEAPSTIEEMRAWFRELMAPMIVPEGIQREPVTLGGRPALRVSAREPRPGTILYFHGGSYVLGSPTTAMSLTGNLVARTGRTAWSLDYRLAPEHPFPAAIEDGVRAYRELLERGTEPAAIVFAGDSAGGGLTVTTCLAARDEGLPLPAAIVAFSPGLDATRTGASIDGKAGVDPFFTRAGLERTGALYRGAHDPMQPLLSPAVCADLAGFPPILLQVGTNELLLDDSTRLAARAPEAGVDVILDVTADVPHVFQSYAGGPLDEADQALDRAALFISQSAASRTVSALK